MTRAPGPEARLDFTSFGAAGGGRVVVVLREEGVSALDPDARITAGHDARIVAIMVMRDEISDPGAYGGETPGSTTVVAIAELIDEQLRHGDSTFGLVGVGGAGEEAILLANRLGDRVDRLALVAVPEQETPLERHQAEQVMAAVVARTLILNGEKDPDAGADAAQWHRLHLPYADVEIVPADRYGPDRRLSLTDVWERVLAHTAPRDQAGSDPA